MGCGLMVKVVGSDDYGFCFWVVGRGLMVKDVGPMIVSFDFGLWVVV